MWGQDEEFATLDAALEHVASAEDAFNVGGLTVVQLPDGTYKVSRDGQGFSNGDGIGWTYDGGFEDLDMRHPGSLSDTDWTRLFDPCEYWESVGHVRHNLPRAVSWIEDGHAVTFSYELVHDIGLTWDDENQAYRDSDGYDMGDDDFAGWMVVAEDLGPYDDQMIY